MIQSWTDLQTLYKSLINDDSATAILVGKNYMNIAEDIICKSNKWTFLEKTTTIKTVASTYIYELPNSVDKVMEGVFITNGSTDYPITEVKSRDEWNQITRNRYSSDHPVFFFIEDSRMIFFPTPSLSDLDITIPYQRKVKKMSIEDVALSGTFTITNGTTELSSSVALFTPAMVGRFIQFDELSGGDNMGYEIATFTDSTHVILRKPYEGATLTSATVTGKIGECPIIPEGYQSIIPFKAIIIQNYQKDPQKYQFAKDSFDLLYADMKSYFQSKTTKISNSSRNKMFNPNRNILVTTNS